MPNPIPQQLAGNPHALAIARRILLRREEERARARQVESSTSSDANQQRIRAATKDTWTWVSQYTKTYNQHWIEEGRTTAYEAFPNKPYFPILLKQVETNSFVGVAKSRDLMVTWALVAYFTLQAMLVPEREIVFQTMEEEKSNQMIDYAKCLWRMQPEWLKEAFPLSKPLERMAQGELSFANGSAIWGIPGGKGKMRSYHPWGYLNDESCFQPEAGECYEEALSACQKIVYNSTADPGWYADLFTDTVEGSREDPCRGVEIRRLHNGDPIVFIYYYADPDRDPATAKGREWYNIQHGEKIGKGKYKTQASWDREQEIVPNAGGGERVFVSVLGDPELRDIVVISNPNWRPSPYWRVLGGFDHGKTNATALVKAYVDEDGDIYFCGEYYSYAREDWANNISMNAPKLLEMPDLDRADWVRADPSIFDEVKETKDGKFTSVARIYKKFGVNFLSKYEGERSDVTFVERVMERWANIGPEKPPRLYIVCRNASDKRQPGLHPFDCPNLLWELHRTKRVKLSATQLQTRNQTDQIVDKDNHARDAMKYLLLSLPKPAEVPAQFRLAEVVQGLDPTSAHIAALRFFKNERRSGRRSVDIRNRGRMI